MHLFRSHGNREGMFRGHAHFDLPDNPVCWLSGHHPTATLEPGWGTQPELHEWLRIECRVCGRRFQEHELVLGQGMGTRSDWKSIARRRIETFKRLGAEEYLRGIPHRGLGWSPTRAEFGLEAVDNRRYKGGMRSVGFRLHFGGRGSETPIDVGLHAWWWSLYASTNLGGRFAQWIGRGHKRNLRLEVQNLDRAGGELHWELWYDDDGGNDAHHKCEKWRPMPWERRARRAWRDAGRQLVRKSVDPSGSTFGSHYRTWACLRQGSAPLNPLEFLWGHRYFTHVPVAGPVDVIVSIGDFPGDHYPVELTLERQTRARRRGPAWARQFSEEGYTVAWDAKPHGIPVRNHSWKGDEVLASSVRVETMAGVEPPAADWQQQAIDGIVEDVRRDRARYGYVPPKPVS